MLYVTLYFCFVHNRVIGNNPLETRLWIETNAWTNRIHHHFVQGQGNPPECQRFAVHDEACQVVGVVYLWHEGGFPCLFTKWWLIIVLLSPLIAVRNPLFYFRNYYRTFSDHKTAPTRRPEIVKGMTSLYDHHFLFVHNGVVGYNPLETSFWFLI